MRMTTAMAESFVDSFKTELIADRAWRTRSQLELAIVQWVGWYNHRRLHEALGDIPPVEFEQRHAASLGGLSAPIPGNGSLTSLSPRAADRAHTASDSRRREQRQTPIAALSTTTSPPANSTAPNGRGPTATPLPPVEMTSRGQPTNGSDQAERLHGLPTGLGQPTNGSEQVDVLVGCPHSHRRLRLSSVELNNLKTNQPT
jgi:hypothetical protein